MYKSIRIAVNILTFVAATVILSGCAYAPISRGIANADATLSNLHVYRLHESKKSSREPVLVTSMDQGAFEKVSIHSELLVNQPVLSSKAKRKRYFYNGCYQFYYFPINAEAGKSLEHRLCYRSSEDKWYDYSSIYPE